MEISRYPNLDYSNATESIHRNAALYIPAWSFLSLCAAVNTCSFRNVIIDNADLVLLAALLRQDFPDLPSLAIDFTHAPDLLCGPCVRDAFHQHLDNHAVDAVLCPA